MKRLSKLSIALAVAALAAAGCGSSGESKSTAASSTQAKSAAPAIPNGPITIGAAIAKTGFLAAYDEGIKTVRAQIKDINAKGGVLGHQLKLIEADTRSDLQHGAVAAQQLLDKGAQIMLATCDATAGAPAALVAGQAGKVTFTLCASEPSWNPPALSSLGFSTFGSIESEGASGAQFLVKNKGVKKPFLLIDTSITYGKNACKGFEGWLKHAGVKPAGTAEFKNEDASIQGQVEQVRSSGADGLALCSYPPGGAAAIKQLRAGGVDVPVWATNSFDGTFWHQGTGSLKDFYFTSLGSVFGDDPRPQVNAVVKDYLAKGAQDTTLVPAYSTIQAITDAIKATKSVDGKALKAEFESWKDHELLSGPTTYTDKLHVPHHEWEIIELRSGKNRYVTTVKPDFVPTITPAK